MKTHTLFNRKTPAALGLLGLLFLVSAPALTFPPMSDTWEMLYSFHTLDARGGPSPWLHLFNLDPFERMRFQPLAYWFYFVPHLVSGAQYWVVNLLNLLLYWISALMVFRLARRLGAKPGAAGAACLFFALTFNHFDVVLWSSHLYILAGTCLGIGALLCYLDYADGAGTRKLAAAAGMFLMAALCYEAFAAWPLGMILARRIHPPRPGGGPRTKVFAATALALAAIYTAYGWVYLWTRGLHTYSVPSLTLENVFAPARLVQAFFLTCGNALYNNFILPVFPALAFPLEMGEHLFLGGPVLALLARAGTGAVFSVGAAALCVLLILRRRLANAQPGKNVFDLLAFFMLSAPFIVFVCRLSTNDLHYGMTEFRYQYFSNAFAAVAAALFLGPFFSAGARRKTAAAGLLCLLMLANALCIREAVSVYSLELRPLIGLLHDLGKKIKDGSVGPERKVHLPDDLPDFLPKACWNYEIGFRFVPENYRWLFPRNRAACFAYHSRDAFWTVDRETMEIVESGSDRAASGRGRRINAAQSPVHTDYPKDKRLTELGNDLMEEGRTALARKAFVRALKINPRNREAAEKLRVLFVAARLD